MTSISKKILKISDKAYKDKIESEKTKIEERYLRDKKVLERILEFVQKKLVYKNISESSYKTEYVVVTEEILLKDYTTPPKNSWNEGTKFEGEGDKVKIFVNGHCYHHLAGLIENYKKQIDEALQKNEWERDTLYNKKELIDNIEQQSPVVKKLLLDFAGLKESFKES